MLFRTRWYSGNVFEGDESVCVSGCLYVGSTLVLVTMLLSGCRIPVVRLLWEQVDRVQFPASRQWYCPRGLEPVLKVHILLQFQNFGCKTFRFRHVTFRVALLNLHVFRSKF